MIIKENISWKYYLGDNNNFDTENIGKWMYFFDENGFEQAEQICSEVIEKKIIFQAKHTNIIPLTHKGTGVICFYVGLDDIETHKNIITYLLTNNMIKKTKSGKYRNEAFKLDTDTKNKKYGKDFIAKINLEKFIDLNTGDWII